MSAQDRNVDANQSTAKPQIQNSGIQDSMNEDDPQIQNKYYFQNCTVHIDSSSVRNSKMQNCGNHVPQVICPSLFFFLLTFPLYNSAISYSDHYPEIIGGEKSDENLYSKPPLVFNNGMWALIRHSAYCISQQNVKYSGPPTLTDYPAVSFWWISFTLVAVFCLVFLVTWNERCSTT